LRFNYAEGYGGRNFGWPPSPGNVSPGDSVMMILLFWQQFHRNNFIARKNSLNQEKVLHISYSINDFSLWKV
jgi:hypothetical protein